MLLGASTWAHASTNVYVPGNPYIGLNPNSVIGEMICADRHNKDPHKIRWCAEAKKYNQQHGLRRYGNRSTPKPLPPSSDCGKAEGPNCE
jgi:hypothetical protein